jgi:hypothetical protein
VRKKSPIDWEITFLKLQIARVWTVVESELFGRFVGNSREQTGSLSPFLSCLNFIGRASVSF